MGRIGTILFCVAVAALLMWWPSLDCTPPYAAWRSPDGGAVLTVCRRTPPFASTTRPDEDTPGFAVLQTAARIAGVARLPTTRDVVSKPPNWSEHEVVLAPDTRLSIPDRRPSLGTDLLWRLRAAVGQVPEGRASP